jgi:agmatine/peptidylarginine deiminase
MLQIKTVYFSEHLRQDHSAIFNCLKSTLNKYNYEVKTLKQTKDIWIRDFMPIVFDDKAIQYQYMPDYLIEDKTNHRYLTNPELPIKEVGIKTHKTELILDGGNLVKCNGTVIMTDKVFTENIDLSPEDFKKKFLYIKKLIIIPRDPHVEEVYGHADGMVRFISENHLLINSQYPEYFKKKLHKHFNDLGFTCKELKVKESTKYAWGYINFLHLDRLIIQPSIDKVNDAYVTEQLEALYPNITIELCDARPLVKKGGVFNCVSWEL